MKRTSAPYPLPLEELAGLAETEETLALLDTASPSGDNAFSYLFMRPLKVLRAGTPDEVVPLLSALDVYSQAYWLCGYLSYEAAHALGAPRCRPVPSRRRGSLPLAWFGVFSKPYLFDHRGGRWLRSLPGARTPERERTRQAALPEFAPSLRESEYAGKIRAIKRAISRGDTYQVNFTFDLRGAPAGRPFSLYRDLRGKQPTPFCAYLQNESGHVLSFSPELFFRKTGREVLVKPMKGTAARGLWPEDDAAQVRRLAASAKNSAENLMIVDLLRNDLGKVCRTGSVRVTRLFEVETYPTIHQMTSTVKGTLNPGANFSDMVRALFPSGSVTGAPKLRTMEIIRDLERGERGVYCGMLGYVSPYGDAVFNVPIRTLQKGNKDRCWRYRVGSGIVADSNSSAEYRECREKARLLKDTRPEAFELFESLRWEGKFSYLAGHLARLKGSARYFGFPWDNGRVTEFIEGITAVLAGEGPSKVRVFLNRDGTLRWDVSPLKRKTISAPLPVRLSRRRVDENNVFLYHKTTHRPWYREAAEKARGRDVFDVLFTNRKGELTEGTISNLFVQKRGMLYTPPLRSGLLPGVLRQQLLKAGKCREKVLFPEDLKSADKMFCGNSVRGLVEVNYDRETAEGRW